MMTLIESKVKALAELGLTNTIKVRAALVKAMVENPNRYPKNVVQQEYFYLLNSFYAGDTTYVRGE